MLKNTIPRLNDKNFIPVILFVFDSTFIAFLLTVAKDLLRMKFGSDVINAQTERVNYKRAGLTGNEMQMKIS